MKTISIRLPDVEAAMLVEVQKRNKSFKNLEARLLSQIQDEYNRMRGGKA